MSALTTRLGLYKPGGGLTGLITPDEVVDIDKINSNMDILDAAIGARRVTSTTRPSAPFDGQLIYESDTQNVLAYSDAISNWQAIGIPNAPSAAYRDALFPTPTSGQAVYRTDKGWLETYRSGNWVASSRSRIIPTSLSGTGAVQDPSGKITWTNGKAASPLVLDGLFPDGYSQFFLSLRGFSSVGAALTLNLRTAAPADDTTSNYQFTETLSRNGTVTSSTAAAATSWSVPGGLSTISALEGTLYNPNEAQVTTWLMQAGVSVVPQVQGNNSLLSSRFLSHNGLTIMRGMKITTGADFTGTVEIYVEGIPD